MFSDYKKDNYLSKIIIYIYIILYIIDSLVIIKLFQFVNQITKIVSNKKKQSNPTITI